MMNVNDIHSMDPDQRHIMFMDAALEQARSACDAGEVPVGAVLVDNAGAIIASAFNQTIKLSDPSAHAEILAIRKAGRRVQNYRLLNMTLYVTVEPCAMCMGAVIHARLARVVFGTRDPKWGAAGSLYDFAADGLFNHAPEIIGGVREDKCRSILVDFFLARRIKQGR